MKKTHVSIYGLSATGKKSLIRRLLHPRGKVYRDRFRIEEGAEAFGPSFAPLGSYDPNQVRAAIENSAATTIIHQWQIYFEPVVAGLLADHPDWNHRAIVIYRPPQTLAVDLAIYRPTMYTQNPPTHESLAAIWLDQVENNLAKHECNGLTVEVVDGSSDTYAPLSRDVIRNLR